MLKLLLLLLPHAAPSAMCSLTFTSIFLLLLLLLLLLLFYKLVLLLLLLSSLYVSPPVPISTRKITYSVPADLANTPLHTGPASVHVSAFAATAADDIYSTTSAIAGGNFHDDFSATVVETNFSTAFAADLSAPTAYHTSSPYKEFLKVATVQPYGRAKYFRDCARFNLLMQK